MSVFAYYPFIKLGLAWIGATGKCIKAKQAAGETIDVWDWLNCGVQALGSLESDLMPLIANEIDKRDRK